MEIPKMKHSDREAERERETEAEIDFRRSSRRSQTEITKHRGDHRETTTRVDQDGDTMSREDD